jgi:signal transduction histidine kinase
MPRTWRWPWSWLDRLPPVALDGAVAAVLLLLGIGWLIDKRPGDAWRAAFVGILGLQTLPLLWRRRWPVAVLICVAGAFAAGGLLGYPAGPPAAGIVLAIYSVGNYGAQVRRVVVGTAGVVAMAVGLGGYLLAGTPANLVAPGASFVAAWLLGDYIRTRRAHLAELRERASRAEHDRVEDRRRAAGDERARIARDLHDVVAHHVSLIAIQAGAARMVQGSDPEAAVRTLATVEVTARLALVELSRLLGVIRSETGPAPPREPRPGLEYLDDLVQRGRDAGLRVEVVVAGRPRALPEALDLSAYRIVQEAITNVIRHAPATHVEVFLRYGSDELELRVTDDGRGQPARSLERRSGHGIIGMRERVALFGGDLQVGFRAEGGFQVAARLPLKAGEA